MPRNPTIPLLLFLLLLLAGACYTGRLTMGVLEPAQHSLPLSLDRLSVAPITGTRLTTNIFELSQIKQGYLHGIYDVLSVSPRFRKVVLSDTNEVRPDPNGRLYWDYLKKICQNDTTEAVLVLSKAVSQYFYNLRFAQEQSIGIINGEYTFLNETIWIFYYPYKEEVAERFTFTDTIKITGGFSTLEFEDLLYEAFYLIGARAGNRIAPYWQDSERTYFTGPGRQLRKATTHIRKDNWYDAALIWNQVAEESDTRKASRAAHNLALAYERDDMLDQASLWINYADSLYADVATQSYKKILDVRLKNRLELDKQMHGN